MALEKIKKVRGKAVYVPGDDIDTDRIIPARFMKCITFDGLGEFAFYDVRKNEDGSDKKHPLNDPRHAGASILLTGSNFGCGSSREHAPQALHKAGFRGIVAGSYAEIFFGNSTTLGMPCFAATREQIREIAAAVDADPDLEVELDVENEVIRCGGKEYPASLRDSARKSLLAGRWDPIAELIEGVGEVDAVARRLNYI